MAKSTQTLYQRVLRILKFYESRGQNRESVNKVKRKILALKFNINLL